MPRYRVPVQMACTKDGSVEVEAPDLLTAVGQVRAGIGTNLVYPPDIEWEEADWGEVRVDLDRLPAWFPALFPDGVYTGG